MIIFVVIVILAFILGYLRNFILTSAMQNSNKILHNEAIHNLITTKSKFLDSHESGEIMNKFTKDVVIGDEYLPILYTELAFGFTNIIGNLIFFAIADY
mmetsp:Transcript_8332/g.1107  ORF Transcript_8332/g.1107 Transcript_8332/m.1107 type:complete len:99 (+) Transcript_8332:2131-2427(+)